MGRRRFIEVGFVVWGKYVVVRVGVVEVVWLVGVYLVVVFVLLVVFVDIWI